MSIELETMLTRRMAMVETNDDRNGIVVHRSISQRSGANQDPRSGRAVMLVTLVDYGVAVL